MLKTMLKTMRKTRSILYELASFMGDLNAWLSLSPTKILKRYGKKKLYKLMFRVVK